MFSRAISSGNAAGGYFSGRPEPASMTLLLYGAYGYTGELIAREAVDRDMDVIVAGRNGTNTRDSVPSWIPTPRVLVPLRPATITSMSRSTASRAINSPV